MAYDAAYFRSRETWRDWRIEAGELIRAAHIRHGSRVLEIGCGGGGLMRMLREKGAEVVGVDTLPAALDLAKKKLDADPRAARIGRRERGSTQIRENPSIRSSASHAALIQIGKDKALPFRDEAFHAIMGQHVIEHLPDASAALREWHRLLERGGRLALATPNAQYPDPSHFADADHTHIFSIPELRAVAERVGFVVDRCFTIFPFLTRAHALRAAGVIAYDLFRRLPYFSERGRTIMLVARKE